MVWFDPRWLPSRPETREGLVNEERLKGDAANGLADYNRWKAAREGMRELGSLPSFQVAVATSAPQVIGREPELVIASEITRKSNRSLGRLVHSVCSMLPTLPRRELCAVYARLHNVPDADLPLALEAIGAGLKHPLVRPGYRELPVLAKLDDGTLVEGKVDLAYFDGTTWTVIDYKTGSADEARYRNQLRLYAYALEQATQQPVRAVLLQI
ncbi:MAG: PD-(D/E)XK nuclease family protein [Bryobacteraceae bacterium]